MKCAKIVRVISCKLGCYVRPLVVLIFVICIHQLRCTSAAIVGRIVIYGITINKQRFWILLTKIYCSVACSSDYHMTQWITSIFKIMLCLFRYFIRKFLCFILLYYNLHFILII